MGSRPRITSASFTWCRLIAWPRCIHGKLESGLPAMKIRSAGTKKLTVKTGGSGHSRFRITICILMLVCVFYCRVANVLMCADDNARRFVAARDRIVDVAALRSYRLAIECFDSCVHLHQQCPKPQPTSRKGYQLLEP